jgi:hypothetical protein
MVNKTLKLLVTRREARKMKLELVKRNANIQCHYPGQIFPQETFIYLDCDDEVLGAAYNPEIGNAVPEAAWRGSQIRFDIPVDVGMKRVNKLLKALVPVAERIISGYELKWNGNNHIASYTDEADDAVSEMREIISNHRDEWFDELAEKGLA